MTQHPLAIWLFFTALAWLLRRDRRLFAWWWAVGLGTVCAAGGLYVAWRAAFRPGPLNEEDGAALRGVLALGSGFALWPLSAWLRAVPRDLRCLARCARAAAGWSAVCLLLGLVATAVYYSFGTRLAARGVFESADQLFDADPATYSQFVATKTNAHKHPALGLLWRALCGAGAALAGPHRAALVVSSVVGGVSVVLAAAYFRLVTGSPALAVLLALVLGVTAGQLVFAAIPESYILSGMALVLLHVLVARRGLHAPRFRHHVLAAVLASSVTITNAAPAAACYLCRTSGQRRPRALLRWLGCGLLVGALLVTGQNWVLPQAAAALQPSWYVHDTGFTPPTLSWAERGQNLARGLFLDNVVGARPRIVRRGEQLALAPGPHDDLLGRAAAGAWLVVLGAGVAGLLRPRGPGGPTDSLGPTLWAALACLSLAAGLHAVYGNEHIFLYSCTFTVYVLAIAAHGLGRLPRLPALGVLAALTAVLAVNNAVFAARVLAALDQIAVRG